MKVGSKLKMVALTAPLLMAQAAFAADVEPRALDVKVLSYLDKYEPFDGHLFYAGRLWATRSRKDIFADYHLEVYDAQGKLLANKDFGHSLRHVYPFGENAVLVVGLGTDELAHYTVASLAGTDITLTSETIPIGALADEYIGKPGALVFTDPGGYNDPDHPTPIDQPLQTLFSYRSDARWLKPHIAGPRQGVTVGDDIFLVSSPSVYVSGRTLHKINLKTETDEVLLKNRDDIVKILLLSDKSTLALVEQGKGKVLLFNTKTSKVGRELIVGSTHARAVTELGKCLLVGLEDTKQVQVFDLSSAQDIPFAAWDLSGAGEAFLGLRALAVDPVSGNLFGRSAYAASPTDQSAKDMRNSVVMAVPGADDVAVKTCLSK